MKTPLSRCQTSSTRQRMCETGWSGSTARRHCWRCFTRSSAISRRRWRAGDHALLMQEDTCSEEGRRLVEALQAHDWIFCNPYFDCAQCLNGPLFSQRQVRG
jgi:hypothetical protein